MDVQMPEKNGLTATKGIRRCWPLGPKIVAITAYALEGDREMFLEAGRDGRISKLALKGEQGVILKTCVMEAQRTRAKKLARLYPLF